jgi:hypothetical protein
MVRQFMEALDLALAVGQRQPGEAACGQPA